MKQGVRYIIESELSLLKEKIISNHLSAGQKASGRTAASLKVMVDSEFVSLLGRKAIGTLETGRKAGPVPKNFYLIIKKWTKDKGLTFESETERGTFSYFVAKKIAEEGTMLFKEGGRNDIYSVEIPKTINKIAERITERFITEITNIKIN
ncbi:MAG: hypothetical protein ACOYOV_05170 [Bacteroidales bacterium]